eukprot:Hpha_TRINITY_DN31853_c0_g1::TRINITY_DN31853_c0_g1_i1::g.29996::m.29996
MAQPAPPPPAGAAVAARAPRGETLHRGHGQDTSSEEEEEEAVQSLDPRRRRPRGPKDGGLRRRKPPHGAPRLPRADPGGEQEQEGVLSKLSSRLGLSTTHCPSEADRRREATKSLLVNMGYGGEAVDAVQAEGDAEHVGRLRESLHAQRASGPPDPDYTDAAEVPTGVEDEGGSAEMPAGGWFAWAAPVARRAAAATPLVSCWEVCVRRQRTSDHPSAAEVEGGILGCYSVAGEVQSKQGQPAAVLGADIHVGASMGPQATSRGAASDGRPAPDGVESTLGSVRKWASGAADSLPSWPSTGWFEDARKVVKRKMENDDRQFFLRNKDELRGLQTNANS